MSDYNESKWKEMALKNTVIRVLNGSEAYGLNLGTSSDRDEMGVCVESLDAFGGFSEFEQYIHRTATERTGVSDQKSEAGDLDLVVYGLRKFLRLATQGNPSVLTLLYMQPEDCLQLTAVGRELQAMAPYIVSRQAGKRFLGYMESQRQRLLGERGQKKTNRPELEEKYGYDTKYAMHIVRLGLQGVELLSTGKITLPMTGEDRAFCLGIRTGKVTLDECLNRAGELERELKDLLDSSPLPEQPDLKLIQNWMLHMYWEQWLLEKAE